MSCNRKTYYISPQAAQALRKDGLGWMLSSNEKLRGPCRPSIMDRLKGVFK